MPERYTFDAPTLSQPETLGAFNILKAHEKALKVLSDPIDPENFTHYRDVPADIRYVEEHEEIFQKGFERMNEHEQYFYRMGKIFEAVMFERIELSNWLGENAITIQASRYDDIKNGVDVITEFDEGENKVSHLAMAFDVTTSEFIRKKFDRIREEITAGELTRVKYFESDRLNLKGEKTKIPRVIVGANRETVEEIANLWLHGRNSELGDHPVQFKILVEIREQLEAFQVFAESIGRHDIGEIYHHGLEIISGILEAKAPSPEILESLESDDVYKEIVARSRSMAAL